MTSLVSVYVFGEQWNVPRGFGVAYRRAARPLATAEVLRDLLELVGWTAAPEVIEAWPALRRVEAEVYAVRVHLRAGDNIVTVPPRPAWFPEPWQGEGSTVFEKAPTPLEGPEARPKARRAR